MTDKTATTGTDKPATAGASKTSPVSSVDTTWGGWVCWAEADDDQSAVDEIWGDGFFLGMYPVEGAVGVFLGCPDTRQPLGPRRFAGEVRSRLTELTPRIDACLTAVAEAESPFFWPLRDSRARRWSHGRTVLLGDAAAGFLPTAGIGAGMAMESAGVLADELSALGDRPSTASSADSSAASGTVTALGASKPPTTACRGRSRQFAVSGPTDVRPVPPLRIHPRPGVPRHQHPLRAQADTAAARIPTRAAVTHLPDCVPIGRERPRVW